MRVKVDERLLRRVIHGLVGNAVKVTRPQGRVIVGVERGAEGSTVVTVRDAGSGVPTDFRAPRPAKTAGQGGRQLTGTDLILSLAERVARLHGGSLTIVNLAGEGSAVSVALPASAANP